MCTYNGAEYLVEQLESMAAQTLLPAEIVVSDDGSTDGTVALLKQTWERLAEHSSEVRKVKLTVLSNKTSLGVTKNFEQAIAATTSIATSHCIRLMLSPSQSAAQLKAKNGVNNCN